MRIAVAYPPLAKRGHYALLGQNRQFKYSASNAVRIFPLVPASAATLVKEDGHDVLFLDGINRRLTPAEYSRQLMEFKPDLVVMEAKAPVLRDLWREAERLKLAGVGQVALVGDHVTALPLEAMQCDAIDYCLTGGDYDVTLRGLARHLAAGHALPLGVYFRKGATIRSSGDFVLSADLDHLPFIDRDLTAWRLYGEAYLYHPAAYILSGRGCGIDGQRAGSCTFCVWQHTLWRREARLRSPANVVAEIHRLVERYRVKEIFDDNEAGPFWDRDWLREFAERMRQSGLADRVKLSANARADALDEEVCRLQKASGFRLLKVGLESGCDGTLKRLSKLEDTERIKRGVQAAKDTGLAVLLTTMVGYPWETDDEVAATYRLARDLMLYKTRLGDSLQASIIVPYPGTPLHRQAEQNDWLTVAAGEYEGYDMSAAVLRTDIDASRWCRRMWRVHHEPRFVFRTMMSVRSLDDLALLWRGTRSLLGHLRDYRGGR